MRIWSTLRSSLVAGVALIAPLVVTVLALQFLVDRIAKLIDPIVQETRLAAYTGNVEIAAQLLAVAVIVGLLAALGYVAQRSFGERLFGLVDRGVGVVPLARVIYASVRQVSDALLARSNRFESTVLVEHPREGIYSIGFVTGESPDPVGAVAGQPAYNVYLPNSPNPTAGRLVMVPADQIHHVDISVREGVRLVVTTGIAEREDELATLADGADGTPTTA